MACYNYDNMTDNTILLLLDIGCLVMTFIRDLFIQYVTLFKFAMYKQYSIIPKCSQWRLIRKGVTKQVR